MHPCPDNLTRCRQVTLTLLVSLACLGSSSPPIVAQTGPSIAAATRVFERNVVDNIQLQPIGRYAVVDLALPDEFLQRLADIEIRWSFHLGHHSVYRDVADSRKEWTPTESTASADWIGVHFNRTPEAVLDYRRSFPADRPALRGFRAPILERAEDRWPGDLSGDEAEPVQVAERIVAQTLTTVGLLPTLARVLETLGPSNFTAPDDAAMDTLRTVGLPLDLLLHFPVTGEDRRPASAVGAIARRLSGGTPIDEVLNELAAVPFEFVRTERGFTAASESGEHDIGTLRLQLARGGYWRGPGGGDSVDIARQLAAGLPDAALLVTLEARYLEEFVQTARGWPNPRKGRLTVIAEPLTVTQWAQDNGKAGLFVSERDARPVPATLVPRYASKRNDASEFIPGDSFLADGLAAAGHTVFQSPLLFQGGDLLVARDPADGKRVLAVSEAEIYRNTSLGLSASQVLDAFKAEFDVDRTVVLPAVAFHLDYDVSLRAHEGRLVAFVNDVDAAMRIVLDLGLDALERAGVVDADEKQVARGHLAAGREQKFFGLIAPRIWKLSAGRDAFPFSVARHFSDGPADSGVGNLQRFLVALDRLFATALPEAALPPNPQTRAYLGSFRRTAAARQALHRKLEDQGWRVVAVPSLPFAERSITYINGIHARGVYVMPAHGGLFAPLDAAAEAAFRGVLGPDVKILRVLSSETQRRSGAVHCSVVAYPVP